MIPSLVRPITLSSPASPESPEDIFSSTPGILFTDDTRNQHGDPGSGVIYKNSVFGDIELRLVDPGKEDERKLFAHYVWNAGILLSELIAGRKKWETDGTGGLEIEGGTAGDEGTCNEQMVGFRQYDWSVKGETVLELGAGSGIVGIVSALTEASTVFITDYPSPDILTTIQANVIKNVPKQLVPNVSVQGHEWGEVSSDFARMHAHAFTRILAADTLWLDSQHGSLLCSMAHFLSKDINARAWVVAGFHTGRARVASFIDEVPGAGLIVEKAWEADVDGRTRAWARERDGGREDVGGRKKWCVIIILRSVREFEVATVSSIS